MGSQPTEERTLRERPRRYREIFGDAEFPPDQVRKLQAAVALAYARAYFTTPEKLRPGLVRTRQIRIQRQASRFFFDPSYRPAGWLFSFPTICQALGTKPELVRKRLKERTPEEVKVIVLRFLAQSVLDDT